MRQVKTGLRSDLSRQDIHETRQCILIVKFFVHANNSIAKIIQSAFAKKHQLYISVLRKHMALKYAQIKVVSVVAWWKCALELQNVSPNSTLNYWLCVGSYSIHCCKHSYAATHHNNMHSSRLELSWEAVCLDLSWGCSRQVKTCCSRHRPKYLWRAP